MEDRYGHDDLITQSLGTRISCLLTELSMGRLYAWYPLTPIVSLTPATIEEADQELRRPDPWSTDGLAGGWGEARCLKCGLGFLCGADNVVRCQGGLVAEVGE